MRTASLFARSFLFFILSLCCTDFRSALAQQTSKLDAAAASTEKNGARPTSGDISFSNFLPVASSEDHLIPASLLLPSSTSSSSLPESLPSTPLPSSQSDDDDYDVSWHELPGCFLHDQKKMWLFPVKVAQGQHVLPFAIVAGTTAALIATDPQTMPHFRQTDLFQDTNHALSSTVSGAIIAVVPSAFYVTALLRKNSYDQSTGLLIGESIVDDTVLMVVGKAITRRLRPSDIPVNGSYSDTFFKSSSGPLGKGSSFPSGHAMMSFSVATIFSHRYRQHRWVPYVAYGLAGAISFTRLTTGAHFPSEVFIGAAAGYAVARFDVLRNH